MNTCVKCNSIYPGDRRAFGLCPVCLREQQFEAISTEAVERCFDAEPNWLICFSHLKTFVGIVISKWQAKAVALKAQREAIGREKNAARE